MFILIPLLDPLKFSLQFLLAYSATYCERVSAHNPEELSVETLLRSLLCNLETSDVVVEECRIINDISSLTIFIDSLEMVLKQKALNGSPIVTNKGFLSLIIDKHTKGKLLLY
jgi:hypothetical protein